MLSSADKEWIDLYRILSLCADPSLIKRLDEVAGIRLCEAEDRGYAEAEQACSDRLAQVQAELDRTLLELQAKTAELAAKNPAA